MYKLSREDIYSFSSSRFCNLLTVCSADIPEGPLKKLFVMVENDSKGRMSYITLVAVANDLAALVADFRKIDTNNSIQLPSPVSPQ